MAHTRCSPCLWPAPSTPVKFMCALILVASACSHQRTACPGYWNLSTCWNCGRSWEFSTLPHSPSPTAFCPGQLVKTVLLCLSAGQTLKSNLTSRASSRTGLNLEHQLKFLHCIASLSSVPPFSTLFYPGGPFLISFIPDL